ncbi:MAG: cell envelope protein SmpA [Candidatus Contendobacter odensis]|uniref:Outer membrane protein assembly factor BamE n=1 Tax=Candidatus Contendibacter odensensis TaxID=1400860 RepID=A0A2G6PE01_9GAMM|nr:MAG: cell envelope protein SmpA [Candidatus Contendobacter odensis]
MFRTFFLHVTGFLLLILATGCQPLLPSFYYVPIRQGNDIDQARIAQLHAGMTRQQVQRILGAPLVTDPFHQNRWDYYYHYKKDGNIRDQHRITLFFSGDILDHIDENLD